MKIKYEMEEVEYEDGFKEDRCFTMCPFKSDNMVSFAPRVNSVKCQECEWFVSNDEIEREVECSYGEVE